MKYYFGRCTEHETLNI